LEKLPEMKKSKIIEIRGNTWQLHPEKAVFWEDEGTLILTDLHLGKSGHFRKSGIATPGRINARNLDRLSALIQEFNPVRVLILGDLFHSTANREWLEFEEWIDNYDNLSWELVTGNHDTLHQSFYDTADIKVSDSLQEGPFLFVHDPKGAQAGNLITVSGHVHPGIKIMGSGRQSLRLPCFCFTDNGILLPAFGEFTGLHTIKDRFNETDLVFALVDEEIIEIKP
jgi:uncharacterized protein